MCLPVDSIDESCLPAYSSTDFASVAKTSQACYAGITR